MPTWAIERVAHWHNAIRCDTSCSPIPSSFETRVRQSSTHPSSSVQWQKLHYIQTDITFLAPKREPKKRDTVAKERDLQSLPFGAKRCRWYSTGKINNNCKTDPFPVSRDLFGGKASRGLSTDRALHKLQHYTNGTAHGTRHSVPWRSQRHLFRDGGLASSTRCPQQNIVGLGAVPHQEAQGVEGANNTFKVAQYWKNFISRFFWLVPRRRADYQH